MYYHAAPAPKLNTILREGLQPDRWGRVYMAEDIVSVKGFAQDVVDGVGTHDYRGHDWVIIEVSLRNIVLIDMKRDPDSGERNYFAWLDVSFNNVIPPSHLKFIEKFSVPDRRKL